MEIRLFLPIITLGPVNPVNPPGNTQRAVISHQWHYPETQRKTTKAKNFHKQIFAAMGNIAQKEEKKERRKEGRKEGKRRKTDGKQQDAPGTTRPTKSNWESRLHNALLRSSRSLCSFTISRSRDLMVSCALSIEATRLLPSRFHRCTRSSSALRRRNLVSIFSQRRHCVVAYSVRLTSFIPQVSPVRYS